MADEKLACFVCKKKTTASDAAAIKMHDDGWSVHARPYDENGNALPARVICPDCYDGYKADYNAKQQAAVMARKKAAQDERDAALAAEAEEANERRLRALTEPPDSFKLSDNP